ncbi:uncharacterized protein LOC122550274, partial [Scomber scombrus]
KIKFIKGQFHSDSRSMNPLLLTINNLWDDPFMTKNYITPKRFYIVLGVDLQGKDPVGLIKVNLLPTPPESNIKTSTSATEIEHRQRKGVVQIDYSKLTKQDIVKLATGYGEKNMWLDWIAATAASMNMSNCVACSSARPTLFTTPAPLYPEIDPVGFQCMMSLTMQENPLHCATLSAIFPPVKNSTIPPTFTPQLNNYTCFTRTNATRMGDISTDWCKTMINMTGWQNASTMVWARADLFWYCGDRTLHTYLPPDWSGTCAMVRLGLPLLLLGPRRSGFTKKRTSRDAFDLTSGSTTYVDAIGVPRG